MSRPRPLYPLHTLSILALAACGESATPTQPDLGLDPAQPTMALAARNTWTPTAPPPYDQYIYGYDLGAAPASAGHSIVYAFGGTSSDEGGTGKSVTAYDVATNTWSRKLAQVGVFYSNGIGKIGSRLYFSGGYVTAGSLPDASAELWAYDYANDRMIRKARLPIFSAEGVSGVINGKLYVLPGACNGNGYPNPGYCSEEQTRRFYRYDPTTNTWVTRRWAPHFHRRGAAAVIDGKFYVAGGFMGFGTPVTALDVYDPATDTWRTLAPLPIGGGASGAGVNGKFYVAVGGSAYAYDRGTNQWKARAAPEFAGSMTRVTLDGRSYLFTATGDKGALYTP